ncbi:MAG: symmetrical bis(5'-nucleosyl)-tetraphosphatase [Buchnera aphidicola (Periphyllus lyropictus)]|uniref:symmetrical bis(5'-nucleosyl)-tetraphosphatase n=1 Tax=Buchnera aphidicola TaxID=9 RepID=UPI001ED67154|nr:symmetrical bis(5'-nucleosyl)-tetraphosphatase [Buchnera aphidicola]NIH16700.1 symmetrical bis(5'-nucleosyl)-tetraphosphatase [Buchnera aphidicola (Periphyllus lyropictus)]USS94607.1 symmetrical bis(5'-nucleosyl)-tetraphosphatase [Buchnera aphidicola (Periphyllus lyropictus)]
MSTYFIGDIHGCYKQFRFLLEKINFDILKDELWITGDLIGRGPDSFKVLKYIFSLGKQAKLVLGNHDVTLLSIYYGVQKKSIEKEISELLSSNNLDYIINKLRKVPLIQYDLKRKLMMSHAGFFPYWDAKKSIFYAKQAQDILSGKNFLKYLKLMRGDFPNFWSNNLNKYERFRFIINVYTRMRYCNLNKELDFSYKDTPPHFNKSLLPWFDIDVKSKEDFSLFFGHWSSLGDTKTPKNVFPLDTGCCWGRYLTILRWEDKKIYKIKCNLKT